MLNLFPEHLHAIVEEGVAFSQPRLDDSAGDHTGLPEPSFS